MEVKVYQNKSEVEGLFMNILLDVHDRTGKWETTIRDHTDTAKTLLPERLFSYRSLKIYASFSVKERDI